MSPTLLSPNSSILDESGNQITTWCQLNIMIGQLPVVLAEERIGNRIVQRTMNDVLQAFRLALEIRTYLRRDEELTYFINGLLLIIPSCMDPSSRVFKSA